jgi:hypothetical protein
MSFISDIFTANRTGGMWKLIFLTIIQKGK